MRPVVDDGSRARAYLLLALRLDRLVPGVVGGFHGDPSIVRLADQGAPRTAADLHRDADRLLGRLAADHGERGAFLRGQVRALRATADRLVGAPRGFVVEIEETFGVRPGLGDPQRYLDAHHALAEALPGRGPLVDRMAAYRATEEIPGDRLVPVARVVGDALRERVRAVVALPDHEQVEYATAPDAAWSALHRYRGGLRSTVRLAVAARHRASALLPLLAHETYPGHHTEAVRKDVVLVRGRRWTEHTVQVTGSPQGLVAEGLAECGLDVVLGPGWGAWSQEVLAEVGVTVDGELAERVVAAQRELRSVRLDAALLLHDRGRDQDAVLAHLRRWLVLDDAAARRAVAFLTHPRWRTYAVTYVEGRRLVERALRDAGTDPARAFVALLDAASVPQSRPSRDGAGRGPGPLARRS